MARRPKDKQIKELTGAKKRPEVNVHVPAAAPPMPDHFKAHDELVSVWVEVVTDLDRLNMLSKTDAGTVEAYVANLARLRRLETSVMERGESYAVSTKTGTRWMKNPDVDTLLKCQQQLRMLATEMGCTPASRSRVPALINGDLFENNDKNRFSKFN